MMTLLFFTLSLFASPDTPETVHLGIGETYQIATKPLASVRVQKKGLLQIKDEGKVLTVSGKKLGTTKLKVGTRRFQFKILHKTRRETLTQLTQWLKNKRGPKLRVISGMPTIEGRLLRLQDFRDLHSFTNSRSIYRMATKAEARLQKKISEEVLQLLEENNLPGGTISFSPFWQYHISKSESKNVSRYEKRLAPLGLDVVVNNHSLNQRSVIKIQVYIAHVKKNFLRRWGLNWPGEFKAQILPKQSVQIDTLPLSLQALEDHGEGKMLATPTLITESGVGAEFHSGGEFPVRTTTQFNNNVEWKRYGLFLKTTPIANARRNLKVKIDIEMSSLDKTHGQTDIPALSRSHIKTQVNMKSPQPILLSGFLQQQTGNNRSGLPWLQQIPLFSPLFSSGEIYDNDFELVFILIPSFHHD